MFFYELPLSGPGTPRLSAISRGLLTYFLAVLSQYFHKNPAPAFGLTGPMARANLRKNQHSDRPPDDSLAPAKGPTCKGGFFCLMWLILILFGMIILKGILTSLIATGPNVGRVTPMVLAGQPYLWGITLRWTLRHPPAARTASAP